MKLIALFGSALAALALLGSQTPQGKALVQTGLSGLDGRPVKTILIIGNSRTYYHDMPVMISRIAASAGSPYRYAITTLAWGGASFQQNWESEDVQRALARRWDQVILQPESRAQVDDSSNASFFTYGSKLIQAARTTGSPVAIIVNWGYGESLYTNDPPNMRQRYIQAIDDADQTLAQTSGAKLIETSDVWEQVHAAHPDLLLYEDGNHPTIYGSYLSALMIDGFMEGRAVSKETYAPEAVDQASAFNIRQSVAAHYALTPFSS